MDTHWKVSNTNYQCFGGHFDGNGHTISGLYINSSDAHVGFFGYVYGASIMNLVVKGDTIVGRESVGGIIGHAEGKTTIRNCFNQCDISSSIRHSSENCSGGIVGYVNNYCTLTITNCYNTGRIISYSSGGIVGLVKQCTLTVSNCYNTGNIYSPNNDLSGCIVGYVINSKLNVTNCNYLSTCGGNNTYGGSPMSVANMRTAEFVDVLNAGTCAWEQDTMPYTNDGYPLLTMMITDANTDTATDLTAYSATLHGSVRVERATVVSKGFEYRAVGDSAYIVVPITQPTDTFSYLLNGLAINKNYEYRTFVKVAECIHTIYGEPQRFEISWLNDDTINIHDATMLRWVADKCNSGNSFAGKYIRLMNNIVLPKNVPNNMTSIGIYPNYPFCGTFDGNVCLSQTSILTSLTHHIRDSSATL